MELVPTIDLLKSRPEVGQGSHYRLGENLESQTWLLRLTTSHKPLASQKPQLRSRTYDTYVCRG